MSCGNLTHNISINFRGNITSKYCSKNLKSCRSPHFKSNFAQKVKTHRSRIPSFSPHSAAVAASLVTMPTQPQLPKQPVTEIPSLTISLTNGDLITSSGTLILQGLSQNITARQDGSCTILATASTAGPTAMLDTALGQLKGQRFLALGRTCLWWMTPSWGTVGIDAVPAETQFLLVQLEDNTCALVLPLLDSGKFRGTLRPDASSATSVAVRMESGASEVTAESFSNAVLVAAGQDPYELVARGVAAAAALSGSARPRSEKAVPPMAEYFGWCTWDSFYSTVSAAGLKAGLESFAKGGVHPRGIIIDDGWQMTDVDQQYRRLDSDKKKVSEAVQSPEDAQVEEAAVELLSGPGDQSPEALKGEHELATGSAISEPADASAPATKKRKGLFGAIKSTASHAITATETALLHIGKHILDSSQSDSLVVRGFSALATGPLRSSLLRFYAHSTEHTRRLTDIQANAKFAAPESGPEALLSAGGGDLAAVVSSIKSTFGVKYVYAWHAMGGFWGGLGLEDPNVAKYNPTLLMPTPTPSILEVDPAVAWVQPVVAGVSLPLDPTTLHQDMHSYLQSCGISGVKVDVQGTIGLAGSAAGGGPALAAAYHSSLEASVAKHFPGNHLINCMCHSTEDIYNLEHSNLARVSDDFYPRRPASHTSHIANCSFNSLFMGEIVVPDWDMFQSLHPMPNVAFLHAAARAVSGGPIYVSDRPGVHDFELLKRLVLRDGSVLRALLPGRPTADCLFQNVSHDGKTALKIWNQNAVNGVVGVFNVQGSSFSRRHRAFKTHDSNPSALKATVKPGDVPTLLSAPAAEVEDGFGTCNVFVLYSDRLKTMKLVDNDETEDGFEVEVAPNGGCDLVTVVPVSAANGVLFAAIGLVNMLNAGGAVMESTLEGVESSTGSVSAALKIRGEGQFLAYGSHSPSAVLVGGKAVQFDYDEGTAALRFEVVDGSEIITGQECLVQF